MSKKEKSKAAVLIVSGVFLLAFPAIGGLIFAAAFDISQYLDVIISASYYLWGWASVLAGLVLIVLGSLKLVKQPTN